MQRVLERSVQSLSRQLRGGSFEPAAFELSFGGQDPGSIPGLEIPLTGGRKMLLRGRIDRLDRCTQGDVVYVKVIDYKSGGLDLSPAKIREGRQLQLLVYMLEALTWEEKRHPGRRAVPAAMLYYQLKDPVITLNRERGPAGAEEDRSLALRPTGMLNPSPEVMELLENGRSMGPSSLYPVQYLKNGGVRASSRLFDEARFAELSEQALQVMQEMGEQILAGCIELRPYRRGTENACSYCPYKDVCGFDLRLPGYGTKGD